MVQITRDCRIKESASCIICKQKKSIDKACPEKSNQIVNGGKYQSPASVCAVSEKVEVNKNDFVVNSRSTDHIVFDGILIMDLRQKNEVVLSPSGEKFQLKG